MYRTQSINELERSWANDLRWKGIVRPYTARDVDKLRGTVQLDHSIARMGAERLWNLLHTEKFVRALGALTGNQAVQQVQAGLKAIYLSGWQVAGDANDALTMYPDQSLYPVTSVPSVIRKINNALMRADQIQHMEGKTDVYYFAPIVADAEAGFGGPLNTFELIKSMIEAGAGGDPPRGPALLAEEVRAHGGKGARPDPRLHPEADRGASRGRRHGRPDRLHRPDRLARREPDPRRHRQGRPGLPDRRADRRRLLHRQGGHRLRRRPGPRLRPVRRPDLVRDGNARHRRGARLREGRPREVPREDAGLQLLALLQLEAEALGRRDRRFPGGAGRRWATSSSSSRSRASTR